MTETRDAAALAETVRQCLLTQEQEIARLTARVEALKAALAHEQAEHTRAVMTYTLRGHIAGRKYAVEALAAMLHDSSNPDNRAAAMRIVSEDAAFDATPAKEGA